MTFIPRDIHYSDIGITNYLATQGYLNRAAIDWFQIRNFILSPSTLEERKHRFDYFHKYVREAWDPSDRDYRPSQRIEDGRFTINACITTTPSVAYDSASGYVRMWTYNPPYYDNYSFYPARYFSQTHFRYGSYGYYYQLFYYPKWWEDNGYGDPRNFGLRTREGMVVDALRLDSQRRFFLMATRYPFSPYLTELKSNTHWRITYDYWWRSQNSYDYTSADRRF
jgi:hypothetical protein